MAGPQRPCVYLHTHLHMYIAFLSQPTQAKQPATRVSRERSLGDLRQGSIERRGWKIGVLLIGPAWVISCGDSADESMAIVETASTVSQ